MHDPSDRPRVSVVLIAKDAESHLGRQLAALDAQDGAPPFEAVVVDNGSRDATAQLVGRWVGSQLRGPDHAVLVDAGDKPGIPYARNQGILASRGDIIAFCDADDAVAPGWVAAIARGLTAPGMVGGRNDHVSGTGEPLTGPSSEGLTTTDYLPFAQGCNFAVTRDCCYAVGGFDESLPPYGYDDVDFSWRVQEAGYPLHYLDDAVVTFTIPNRRRAVRKEFLLAKARMAVVHRHPEFDLTPYSLPYCLADAARSLVLLPFRLVRPRETRPREVRWTVDAIGRLAGYWHYSVRGRDSRPVLLESDPLARG